MHAYQDWAKERLDKIEATLHERLGLPRPQRACLTPNPVTCRQLRRFRVYLSSAPPDLIESIFRLSLAGAIRGFASPPVKRASALDTSEAATLAASGCPPA